VADGDRRLNQYEVQVMRASRGNRRKIGSRFLTPGRANFTPISPTPCWTGGERSGCPFRGTPIPSSTFVAYPTSSIGEAGPRGERFLDEARIDGALPLPETSAPGFGPVRTRFPKGERERRKPAGPFSRCPWERSVKTRREFVQSGLALGAAAAFPGWPRGLIAQASAAGPAGVEGLAFADATGCRW
jgi:hypothetical protein